MYGFAVVLGSEFVFFIFVLHVTDVVVANTSSFVVLAIEKDAGFR